MVSVHLADSRAAGRFWFYLETSTGNFSAPRFIYVLIPLCREGTSLLALILGPWTPRFFSLGDPGLSVHSSP